MSHTRGVCTLYSAEDFETVCKSCSRFGPLELEEFWPRGMQGFSVEIWHFEEFGNTLNKNLTSRCCLSFMLIQSSLTQNVSNIVHGVVYLSHMSLDCALLPSEQPAPSQQDLKRCVNILMNLLVEMKWNQF